MQKAKTGSMTPLEAIYTALTHKDASIVHVNPKQVRALRLSNLASCATHLLYGVSSCCIADDCSLATHI